MNTQTHLLISAFLFAQPDRPKRNLAVLLGAVLPDLSIYLLVIWAKIWSVPEREIWGDLYWREPWQSLGAISNSIPVYLAGLLICLFFLIGKRGSGREGGRDTGQLADARGAELISVACTFLFASCLVHILFDFPVHTDDAHRHFWPLSDWKFHSPISYWNGNHFGNQVQVVEFVAAMVMIVVLYRRFRSKSVHVVLLLAGLAYFMVPLYWAWQLS